MPIWTNRARREHPLRTQVRRAQQLKITEYRLPPDKLAKLKHSIKHELVLYLFRPGLGILVLGYCSNTSAPAFRDIDERGQQE